MVKVELDFYLGMVIFTFIAADLSPIRVIYGLLGIAMALIPDGLLFLYYISGRKCLKNFHRFNLFIHYFKRKRKPKLCFLTVFTQVLATIIAILILIL